MSEAIIPQLLTMSLIRQHYLPLSESTLYSMISTGKFPKADVQMGTKIRLWRREVVEGWVDDRAGLRGRGAAHVA